MEAHSQVMPMVSGCIYAVNVAEPHLNETFSELAFLIYRIFYIRDGIIVCFIASKMHEQD